MLMHQEGYRVYSIGSKEERYEVRPVSSNNFYGLGCSCRKAYCGVIPERTEAVFHDFHFPLNLEV